MGVNKVIYNGTTLIDLTGDTVTASTLAQGKTAHDKSGNRIVGTMSASQGGGTTDNYITEVGVMIDGEPVTIRDDGSRLTTVVNADESIVETRTFRDGTTETKTTVFNADDTVTETTVANGKTTTKKTTFTDLGQIVMNTDNGNQVHFGENAPAASIGKNGDVYVIQNKTVRYVEIEYIESTGTQYVDTGFKPNQDTRVVMDVQSVGINTADTGQSFFGARNGSSYRFFAFWHRTNAAYYIYYNNTSKSVASSQITNRMTVTMDGNNLYVGDSVSVSVDYATFSCDKPLYLFATNLDGTADYFGVNRVYSCKIYDNGTLVRDYVPALDLDGVACLYDRLNGEYHRGEGTGSFKAGNIVDTKITTKDIAMYMKINGVWSLLTEVA